MSNCQPYSVAVKLGSTTDTSPVTKFDISLQHSDDDDDDDDGDREHHYQPGDWLSGDVVLVLAAPMRVSSIVVELRGEASVACKVNEHAQRGTSTTTSSRHHSSVVTARRRPAHSCSRWYQTNELYVDERHEILLGTDDDDVLQPGEHRFPISFHLPCGLPTSFRGKFGGVSYVLRASFINQTSKSTVPSLAPSRYVICEPFVVRRPSPPPAASHAKPLTVKLSRRLFAAAPFICASGLLHVDFTVADGTTYRLGDDIRVVVQVTNESPRVVVGVTVALVQLCEFRAQTARRRSVALVSRERNAAPVGYADNARCMHFRLNVPTDLPESRLDGCDVIDVDYQLRFAVQVVILVINQWGKCGCTWCNN